MSEKYSVHDYTVEQILNFIKSDYIAIPEIQRPFVWKGKQVRDLVDSLYKGYPTGYIIISKSPDLKRKRKFNLRIHNYYRNRSSYYIYHRTCKYI